MKNIVGMVIILLSNMLAINAATVTWQGSNPASVEDTNVKFKKNIILPQDITIIRAATKDVSIHLEDKPVLRNSKQGASELLLVANQDRTITVHVDQKVKFRSKDFPLTVRLRGSGRVIWKIKK